MLEVVLEPCYSHSSCDICKKMGLEQGLAWSCGGYRSGTRKDRRDLGKGKQEKFVQNRNTRLGEGGAGELVPVV